MLEWTAQIKKSTAKTIAPKKIVLLFIFSPSQRLSSNILFDRDVASFATVNSKARNITRAKTQLLGGSRLHDKHADNPGDHQHRTNANGPIATQMMRSRRRRGRHQISTCCESDNSKTDDNIVNHRILH